MIVPDYKTDDLSGDLSHNLKRINEDQLEYVGALSDFSKKNTKKDIDYLISISGPEPQRTLLEKTLMEQVKRLQGTIVVTLGKTEQQEKKVDDHVTSYSFVDKAQRENLLNRAHMMIARSGYSTLMDLAVIGSKAVFIPTPGQIEQEYLASYHHQKHTFYATTQDKIQLHQDVQEAEKTTGITQSCSVKKTVEQILSILSS